VAQALSQGLLVLVAEQTDGQGIGLELLQGAGIAQIK
jgi:hypothetical protein